MRTRNITLNPGGFIGAAVGAAGLGAVVVLLNMNNEAGEIRHVKLILSGVIGGAVAGNFLWAYLFPGKQDPPDDGDITATNV